MKKIFLSAFVLVTFTGYALHNNLDRGDDRTRVLQNTSTPVPSLSTTKEIPAATLGPTPVSTNTATKTSAPVATPARTGKYKDGTYTGSVADAFYGNIQVKAVISGGRIIDVIFLQYPSDRQTSIEINSQAMPTLKQEAISAQSAQVSGVSGATASSGAFIQSLSSALQQAV